MPTAHNQPYEVLYARIEGDHVRFTQAETLGQYQVIRDSALAAAQTATEIKAPALAFRARTLAAQCAFAASKEGTPNDRQDWLVQTFLDLLTASDLGGAGIPTDWLLEFASLLCNLHRNSWTTYWFKVTKTQVTQWFRHLTRAAETFVPLDLEDKKSAARTNEIARLLAELSYLYGTQKAADARFDFAIANARRTGDLQSLIDLLYTRYQRVKPESDLASARLDAATSLDDLEAWTQDLLLPQDDRRTSLADEQKTLRDLATAFRSRFRSRTGRLWAAQYLAPMLSEFLQDEFAEGHSAEALLEATDGLKARLLLDYLNTPYREFTSAQLEAQAVEIEQQLLRFKPEPPEAAKDSVFHLIRLVSQLPIGWPGDHSPRHPLYDAEADAQRKCQLHSVEALHKRQNAGFRGTTVAYTYGSIAEALGPDEVLIEYYTPFGLGDPVEQTVFVFVLTREVAHVQPIRVQKGSGEQWVARRMSADGRQPAEQTVLGDQIIAMRLAIQEEDDETAHHYLQNLYDGIISPVIELGLRPQDFSRWIIVPHAMLHSIPFGALQAPNGGFLIEEVALTVAPSASVWYSLQRRAPSPVTSFVGFANPLLLDAKWPPLPQSEDEIERICDSLKPLNCTSRLSEEATEANVHTNVPGKSIVHFATHGDFPESDVIDMHQVVLTPTGESDGKLHAEELRRLDLHSTRLVALSICDGGLYRIGPGDEPYGLIPALLTAGAENVIGTLWPVEDQTGRAFMVEFYKEILSQGPAEAYRRACTNFLEQQRPLRDWAGWVLVGPGRPWTVVEQHEIGGCRRSATAHTQLGGEGSEGA